MITKEQVESIQQSWAVGVVKMGALRDNRAELESYASQFLDDHYAFGNSVVLFKPTKCVIEQFRNTKGKAISYFINGEDRECAEDTGFAITPWMAVVFENHDIILEELRAIAMGNYFFTDQHGSVVKVEYTFGYRLIDERLKIDLHHSSLPYSPNATA